MSNGNHERKQKLLELMNQALSADQSLREKYQIGDKFRFIRDRLQALSQQIESSVSAIKQKVEKKEITLLEDEVVVYVYLYNTQGLNFQTWQKMLSPSVFYEYSVNRPIYGEKSYVDMFIKTKANKMQHGYLAVAVKKSNILEALPGTVQNDTIGNPLIRVREGSLSLNRLIVFHHNDQDYVVNEAGELTKKSA